MERYELTDDDVGVFAVDTASGSTHLVDLVSPKRTVTRFPRQNTPSPEYSERFLQPSLRRDEESLPLLAVVRIELGRRAEFFVLARTDGVITLRETTPVVRITELRSPT